MKDAPETHFIGIRHHGPGCARHLREFLENNQPDKILIEGPENAQELLASTDIKNFELPVSILLYKEGEAKYTYILPFAEFSPEWVAIKYAKENGIPVEFMDLPLGLYTEAAKFENESGSEDFPIKNTHEAFAYLAGLQGITDVEQWWEINFERVGSTVDYFSKIAEVIYSIRPAIEKGSTAHTKVREAWMRQKIRKSLKSEFKNQVIICGAAHLPFIKEYKSFNPTLDKAILKVKNKINLACNWIPWSYTRLSSFNEYSAGVEYPLFYEHIYKYGNSAPITITTALSLHMRSRGFDISLAHTLEAVNLAQTLAAIRGFDIPGIDIIMEACSAVYNLESKIPMAEMIHEAFVGNTQGSVPINLNQQALIEDFRSEIKKCKFQNFIKDNSENEVVLDLRNDRALEGSKLIWRLKLLDIHWGQISDPFKTTKGTFNEYWVLQWHSEYLIRLFHLCMYGSTIEMAVIHKVKESLTQKDTARHLSDLITPVLNSQIPELADFLIKQLGNSIFRNAEIKDWMVLIPRLITHCRYGSVRNLDLGSVRELIASLIDKICINLEPILADIPGDEIEELSDLLIKMHKSIILLEDQPIKDSWLKSVFSLSDLYFIPCRLRGWMTGVCLEQKTLDLELAYNRMSFELSDLDNIEAGAEWLNGILTTQVFSVFEVPRIIAIINDWLKLIDYEQFRQVLPGLRKSFAGMNSKMKESFRIFSNKNVVSFDQNMGASLDTDLKELINPYLALFIINK